jgi:hypothetical protein
LSYFWALPAIGATSQGLRILSETWTPARDRLTLSTSGLADSQYILSVWNGEQIASVEGAKLFKTEDGRTELILDLPKMGGAASSTATVSIQFASSDKKRQRTRK